MESNHDQKIPPLLSKIWKEIRDAGDYLIKTYPTW